MTCIQQRHLMELMRPWREPWESLDDAFGPELFLACTSILRPPRLPYPCYYSVVWAGMLLPLHMAKGPLICGQASTCVRRR